MKLRPFLFICLPLFLLLATLGGKPAAGQALALKSETRPFPPGEELTYKAEISRSLLRKVDVATFTFKANVAANTAGTNGGSNPAAPVDPQPDPLKFVGDVVSDGFFASLFGIRFHQHVESTVDGGSLSVQKTVKVDEQGKRVRLSEANFDLKTGKVVWTERDPSDPARPPRTASSDFNGAMNDVVSAIYYLRTLQLDPGKSFELPISDSGRVYQVPVRVVEKKPMKTVVGRVNVLKVEVELFGQRRIVKTKGQCFIWLTDDQRHVPVSAQLKTEYGTFDITLKKVAAQAR